MNTTFALLSVASIIFLVQAIPLALGVVKPNRFYGVRTKSTLCNDALWYRMNKIYGVSMVLSSFTYFVICFIVGCWRTDVNHGLFNLLLFIAQVIMPVLITAVSFYRSARRYDHEPLS
ncbi:MAG: SdpI family protein [Azoarcus sp.]|jgi:uncharacterized membrane protein|nr:SdpI family protein [Azoarcus sp.]